MYNYNFFGELIGVFQTYIFFCRLLLIFHSNDGARQLNEKKNSMETVTLMCENRVREARSLFQSIFRFIEKQKEIVPV